MSLITEKTMCDWLTITTFNSDVGYTWRAKLMTFAATERDYDSNARWLQYSGARMKTKLGSVFCGRATMKHNSKVRTHYAMTISAELADMVLFDNAPREYDALNGIEKFGEVAMTRIDIQRTVKLPTKFRNAEQFQREFFIQQQGLGRTMSWAESAGRYGKLCTVGINSRKGDVYHRVYAKDGVDGQLERFETEYTGTVAKLLQIKLRDALAGKNARDMMDGWLVKQVGRTRNDEALYMFAKDRSMTPLPKRELVIESQTALWMLKQVLPALRKMLRSPERGTDATVVVEAFFPEIDEYLYANNLWPMAASEGDEQWIQ